MQSRIRVGQAFFAIAIMDKTDYNIATGSAAEENVQKFGETANDVPGTH
ncbi:MAG: hypothetical protein ABFD25_12230 [Clostridiaceae bacterium]